MKVFSWLICTVLFVGGCCASTIEEMRSKKVISFRVDKSYQHAYKNAYNEMRKTIGDHLYCEHVLYNDMNEGEVLYRNQSCFIVQVVIKSVDVNKSNVVIYYPNDNWSRRVNEIKNAILND